MAIYWLTFRIEQRTVSGDSDDYRRERLYEAIRTLADRHWWVEPTSFILFQSEHDIDQIIGLVREAIAEPHDIVLIRNAEHKTARVLGKVDPDLFKLMPYLEQA